MKDLYQQAELVDLSDTELLEFVGFLWEGIKKLDEDMGADPMITRLADELKAYKKEKYLDVKKAYKAKLKAARYLCNAKGIQFKVPEGIKADDL